MAIKNCIVCNVCLEASHLDLPASNTREHILGSWYRGEAVNDRIKMFTASLDSNLEATLQRSVPLEGLFIRGVCQACNQGWMSDLEMRVDPILRRLQATDDLNLLQDTEIETLARWTGKTAVTLSYATPQQAHVPQQAAFSLHPESRCAPRLRLFYSRIYADRTLEGGFLQVVYGSELGLLGTNEVAATRMTMCFYNHCLTVDFPPIVEGISYDLRSSFSAMIWPSKKPAGLREFKIQGPVAISEVLLKICREIQPYMDPAMLPA